LDGRDQQRHQYSNDGDDNQQLDQGEAETDGSRAHDVALLSEKKDCEVRSERLRKRAAAVAKQPQVNKVG
jgi:hypothetical protein